MSGPWPALPAADWQPTRDTFILWTQVVGKVRLARTPVTSHWWNVPLYVAARGLTTSLVPAGDRGFQVDLDLVDHRLDIAVTDGSRRSMALEPMTTAEFHAGFHALLADLDLATETWAMPVEIAGAIPFDQDTEHASYDADAVHRFWLALVQMDRVLSLFRARFLGKVSPVHLFWGALDLAVTRFSGRDAPPHPGGAPNCGPHVMHEAYSHEVSSAGYWPGGGAEGVFYSYAYPEPPGFRDATVAPAAARWDDDLGEFVLDYQAVRTAADPDAVLLTFLQSTYEAAADAARWDRAALERPPG
ncbi:hypothetical protein HC251_23335 [Iamia sp. SCSIO 61187]|nr:hypothetical protein HC251_23335 [Iamia sp. SCSIO 61187]